MKRLLKRITAVLLAALLFCAVMPVSAMAEGQMINIPFDMTQSGDFVRAFNRATDYARYNQGNNTYAIKVPAGTYYVDSQIRLYSNTVVDFTGCTIIHSTDAGTLLRLGRKSEDWDNADGGAGHPGYSGFSNITIIGGTFDGGGFSQALMRFGHSANITIRNAAFRNVTNTHMIEIGGCNNVTIENCSFSGFNGDWTSATNYETIQFEVLAGNHFSAYHPDNDETPCANCTVRGCTFSDLQRGIGTHTAAVNTYFDNMVFENNYFQNITGYAVSALNYTNSRINGNTIVNCGSGIIFETMQKAHSNFYASATKSNARSGAIYTNSQIIGNNIQVKPGYRGKYKNTPYGIQVYGEKLTKKKNGIPAGDYRCAGLTISGNSIKLSGTDYGIWLLNTVKNTVSYNTISSAKRDGIYVDKGEYNAFKKNTVKSCKRNGIGLYGAKKSTVTGNKITKCKAYGIFISNAKKAALKKEAKNKITKSGKKARSWKKK